MLYRAVLFYCYQNNVFSCCFNEIKCKRKWKAISLSIQFLINKIHLHTNKITAHHFDAHESNTDKSWPKSRELQQMPSLRPQSGISALEHTATIGSSHHQSALKMLKSNKTSVNCCSGVAIPRYDGIVCTHAALWNTGL